MKSIKQNGERMKQHKTEAVLIYPHQLFEENALCTKDRVVFVIEEPLFFTQYRFHTQKLVLHRASMRAYYDTLVQTGHSVHYVESKDIETTKDIVTILQSHDIEKVYLYDVVDDWLERRLSLACKENAIEYSVVETPLFLTDTKSFLEYFERQTGSRKYFMKNFYEWQRKRLDILIDEDGKPTGGSWSFDTENRKKVPKGLVLPEYPQKNNSPYVTEAIEYIQKNFSQNYGDSKRFFYPVTHGEAKKWLKDFLEQKLSQFGPYEDAMTTHNGLLFHSVLSPLLNIGLLTPDYVIEKTLDFSKKNNTPIASLEGFVRQIIGWREYMRAIYVIEGKNIRTKNYFHASKNIPETFWTGTTGILPIDHTIKNTLNTSYSHHIERLMVMGNFMNLCGFEPHQVYRWFMEMYIDAYDWVMVPNVYSMALYADGGIITTKPYISGSNYILKMSDYPKGSWSETWDALFWNFVGQHFNALQKEGRLGFIGVLYSKMTDEKKQYYKKTANDYLSSI
jgi:deoxyribodipyrimidine photolyase-related protein